ncbi:MAG: hypothetical protein R8M38_05630, partial [Mariprofundaceae bacterium]
HKYLITHAIADDNVLKFSIEYWGKLKRKDGTLIDEQVPAINIKAFFENPERIDGIVDWVIAHHNRKTHNKQFSAMMCVNSVDMLITYYEAFKRKKEAGEHDLRVATIFTYSTNEEDADANGLIGDPDFDIRVDTPSNKHSREKLEEYVADYNAMYQTQHSVKDSKAFYTYYKDIAKRMKERDKESFLDRDRADILLVVNMFLTGFDAKKLNTMYVDKNLKHHGLLQAFSRTNRILNEKKSQGNIVCFRNLKKATDDAIALFSNVDAKDTIIMAPYEDYVRQFNKAFAGLLGIAPTVDSVDGLVTEEDELEFIKAFRELLRVRNVLTTFADFTFDDLAMNEQSFNDYRSKYLDLYDKVKSGTQKEKVSILDDVDFELELIHRDEINVTYIIQLLAKLKEHDDDTATKQRKAILDLVAGDAQLRSKRSLIEKFILENLPNVKNANAVPIAFSEYWDEEKQAALAAICEDEQLSSEKVEAMINQHLFTEITPLRDDVVDAMLSKPKLMQRKRMAQCALDKIMGFVETFIIDAPEKPSNVTALYPKAQTLPLNELPLAAESPREYE